MGNGGNILHMPEWWNGRHRGLKIPWRQLRDGSSPFSGTKTNRQFTQVDWRFVLFFSLFNLLYSRKGEFVSRDEILALVWNGKADKGILNVYVHYLREKLEKNGEKIILSSRNYGYKINEKYLGGIKNA